jgi:hypothetical protein
VTAVEVHDLAAAVSRVQARTTRSRQTALGASELGTCRRRTAYRLAGTVETNPGGGMTAALGTWIHKGALDVLRREYGALIEVRLASPLICGKADALYPDAGVVEDVKTKGRYVYAQTLDTGPRIGELFQVHVYGWLLREGHIADRRRGYPTGPVPVDTVRLRFIDRDTGASHPWEAPYDPQVTAEALGWLAGVLEPLETGGPDAVPRDGDGPGVSKICGFCPFADLCWPQPLGPDPNTRQSLQIRDDAELAAAAAEYDRGRRMAAEGEEIKKRERARLDGAPAGLYSDLRLSWSVRAPKQVPDTDAMIAQLEEAGIVPRARWTPRARVLQVRPANRADLEVPTPGS